MDSIPVYPHKLLQYFHFFMTEEVRKMLLLLYILYEITATTEKNK